MLKGGRKIARLSPDNVIFFECDIQQKLTHLIYRCNTVVFNAAKLAQTAKIFDIPVLCTKQVNFGPVAEDITKHHHEGVKVFEKKTFSMLNSDTLPYIMSTKRTSVVLYGVEAHVCMKQTCLDLLEKDFDVHVVIDACSSMQIADRNVGIQAMRDAGANVTTY